jgi:membrane associated rhomboid family serine protease
MNLTYFLLAVTGLTSFMAFRNQQLIENLTFYPYRMWRNNEWHRLISCSFIHADIGHLLFNMIALWSFGLYIEASFEALFEGLGHFLFLAMYFGAVATADIINLFKQKDNPGYHSLGASGGIAAVIFSYILLNPYGGISLFFLPSIPSFIFGPLYLAYCVYMAKRGTDNVGHLAHFTGSVFGFFFPLIFEPRLFMHFVNQLTGNV